MAKVKNVIVFLTFSVTLTMMIPENVNAQNRDTKAYDEGVVINGVKWATRNVGAPGSTFVPLPQNYGGLYNWKEAQNACPCDWRLPTIEEIESLFDAGSQWTTLNGINGYIFGIDNTIFIPAAGYSHPFDSPMNVGLMGVYQSSSVSRFDSSHACRLIFSENDVSSHCGTGSTNEFSVRCVAK